MTPAVALSPPHDDNVPALGTSVIVWVEVVTTLLPESSTLTTGWVVSAAPDAPAAGWVVKTSWVAVPVETVMPFEAAEVKPPPVKVRV